MERTSSGTDLAPGQIQIWDKLELLFDEQSRHGRYHTGIVERIPERYLTFNENQRTSLLNYIFAQQVALKKKGLV